MVKIYAPASIGNVSVGFDVLGAAISPIDGSLLGDCVSVTASDTFQLLTLGTFVDKLPQDPSLNIAYLSWQLFCQRLGRTLPVQMTLEKNMPIGSGLGSSACSVVASVCALNEFAGSPFHENELLQMMGELEGQVSGGIHFDNVAPCYLGGMQLILETQNQISQAIPCFDDWFWVMAYPGIKVSTAQARSILPDHYSRHDIIAHGRHLAGFIHACYTQQADLAAQMVCDVVAEPYRMQLLPGFDAARQATKALGAVACGISGSGPTLFALCDQLTTAQTIENWLHTNYVQNSEGFVKICRLDRQGARRIDIDH